MKRVVLLGTLFAALIVPSVASAGSPTDLQMARQAQQIGDVERALIDNHVAMIRGAALGGQTLDPAALDSLRQSNIALLPQIQAIQGVVGKPTAAAIDNHDPRWDLLIGVQGVYASIVDQDTAVGYTRSGDYKTALEYLQLATAETDPVHLEAVCRC